MKKLDSPYLFQILSGMPFDMGNALGNKVNNIYFSKLLTS